MAEVIVSPGVFLRENDLSQVTEGPISAGAAVVGPTVIGPILRPTLVTSYSDYKRTFGTSFVSGGLSYEYFTSIAALNYFEQGGKSLLVTRVVDDYETYAPATASILSEDDEIAFTLETLAEGEFMNNELDLTTSYTGSLKYGSTANVRWEVVTSNSSSGNFTLVIRRGDDFELSKTVLETYTNLSLDPNSSNYIAYVIGDASETFEEDEFGNAYLQPIGSYANKSKYVRVSYVRNAPNYLDISGKPKSEFNGFMPAIGSGSDGGSFSGATGEKFGDGANALNMYTDIPVTIADNGANNIQGVLNTSYTEAINLLKNKEAYDYNIIYAPGLNSQNAGSVMQDLITMVTNRGDAIAVIDMVGYAQSINTVITEASNYDNNYSATYWPWLQIRSRETGKTVFVPASTIVPAIYEYNDAVSAEWFAPAGLNRGGMATVLRPERKLDTDARNLLYQGKVNPIAQFAGIGTVIYGQKTLQNRSSALDRVNVRRLMISIKRYIRKIAEDLLFEPNTQVTRNKFLGKINPYLEFVQQRQGIYAFQVVMDDSNNTSDLVDRNQLVGAVYIQPTRVAEFITIDFNILPTGASFGA